jgi:hypothetical protein
MFVVQFLGVGAGNVNWNVQKNPVFLSFLQLTEFAWRARL